MRRKNCQLSDPQGLYEAGQWQLSLIDRARKHAEATRRARDWETYMDIRHTLCGNSIEDCLNILEQCEASNCLSNKLRLKLSNMILTNSFQSGLSLSERQALCQDLLGGDKFSPASAVMEILESGYLGSSVSHYPALLTEAIAYPANFVSFAWNQKKDHRLASQLKESTFSLRDGICQILEHGDRRRYSPDGQSATVAVVGNSPDLLGQGKGREIDSHDLIVRFNRISADARHVEHTGQRTDIWVMSPSTPVEQCPSDARLIMISGLHSLSRPSFFWRSLAKIGKPIGEFDVAVWYELVQRFNAPPSAGILGFAALQATSPELQIHGFGFTSTHGVHGASPNHHNDQAQVSSRHNWQAEVNWLRDRVS